MNHDAATTPNRNRSEPSDLSKLCLPQEYQDSNRRLAWANSICCLFLLIGLMGLKAPQVHHKPLSVVTETVPVVITTPEEPPPAKTEEPLPKPESLTVAIDQPVVATVVAADPTAAAFAVPVKGPVVLVPVQLAAPPPAVSKAAPNPGDGTALTAAEADWGGKSNQPEYPIAALRKGRQGKVLLEIRFSGTGDLVSVTIVKSSGDRDLDAAAQKKVENDLRLKHPDGQPRTFTWEVNFKLN